MFLTHPVENGGMPIITQKWDTSQQPMSSLSHIENLYPVTAA